MSIHGTELSYGNRKVALPPERFKDYPPEAQVVISMMVSYAKSRDRNNTKAGAESDPSTRGMNRDFAMREDARLSAASEIMDLFHPLPNGEGWMETIELEVSPIAETRQSA